MNWKKNMLTAFVLFLLTANSWAQIPGNKMVTFQDLHYLVENEGFVLKNTFDTNSNKCATKSEIINALYLDDTGQINEYLSNQLVPRDYLVKPVGGIRPFMLTAYHDNVENQDDKGNPENHYLHDGNFTLPVAGDIVYTEAGVPFNGSYDSQPFWGAQRYPSPGEDEVNLKIGADGKVLWVGWVVDRTTTPYNLRATNIGINQFTLNWVCGTKYYNIRYALEFRRLEPIVQPWETWSIVTNNEQFDDGFNFAVNIIPIGKSEWRVRSIPTSSSFWYKYDKVSSTIIVDPLDSYSAQIYSTEQSGDACAPGGFINPTVYQTKTMSQWQVGDYLYTDTYLQNVFNPADYGQDVVWWKSGGDTYSFRIGTDGMITAIATCN